jgi:ABC-type transport system involved in cytochrome c biogenesis permease component
MTFLPIVARELRVASRRRSTYWVRTGAALAVVVLGCWLFFMMNEAPPREIAQALFTALSVTSVLYCLLSGIRATADCISVEKREGTLGLLFLTDLKGYDVVLGKLAATSLGGLYGVLAVVPVLAIPLLMGGVSLGEFGRMALVALNTLFFSLTVGLFSSSVSHASRKAMGLTVSIIAFFALCFPLYASWSLIFGHGPAIRRLFMLPSAGYTFFLAFETPYQAAKREFWMSLAVIHGLAWVFLLLSALIAPRSWQDKPAGPTKLRWRERWLFWSYGDLKERLSFRRRLLDQSAFYWLASRARLKPAFVWGILGLLACGWFWGLASFHREWLNEPIYFVTGLVLNILIKGWFASEAGRQLAEDRMHGTLELLLSTPLTVHDILRGQVLALMRQFLGPLIFVLAVFSVFMLAAPNEMSDAQDHALWVLFWLAAMGMLIVDLVAFYWVGLWQALVAKNPHRAASVTLARILVVPWIAIAGISLFISLLGREMHSEPGPGFFLGLWVVTGLLIDIAFAGHARNKLLKEFRVAATQRYVEKTGFFKALFTFSSGKQPAPGPAAPGQKGEHPDRRV